MNLTSFITELLYRYDCVIVPDFGGFITNKVSAKLNSFTHTFKPPTKLISFNSQLLHNDGLLVNYIASSENISFEEASDKVLQAVIVWKNQLKTTKIELKNIGNLSLNSDNKLIFEPNEKVNYLTESFGLADIKSIEATTTVTTTTPEKVYSLNVGKTTKKNTSNILKYAATATILIALSGSFGYNKYQQNLAEKSIIDHNNTVKHKIQSATFVISDPLPTINLNVTKTVAKPFHIIAGAFKFSKNAEKKVKQLKKSGFNAQIIGENQWGLTQVSFDSFASRDEAVNQLFEIKRKFSKDAWLLVKQ